MPTPLDKKLNGMKENVPVWIPFNPNLDNSLSVGGNTDVYITVDRTGTFSFIPFSFLSSGFKKIILWRSFEKSI